VLYQNKPDFCYPGGKS